MFGHSPATRHHAIRTGSWLAPEALTDPSRVRRPAAALCVIAIALTLTPLAASAARKASTSHGAHSHPPAARALPYPRLEWPVEIRGSQYAPLAWTDVAGWSGDDHLLAYKAFRVSCTSIAGARKTPD